MKLKSYGVNPVKEAIESGKTINKLYGSKGSKEVYELLKLAKSKGIVTVEADKIKLDKMITTENEKLKNSQGIVASVTDYEYYEIEESPKGTHILSTKDLCLVKNLRDMINAGIDSFKVEGRTKSLYYVSAVAKTFVQSSMVTGTSRPHLSRRSFLPASSIALAVTVKPLRHSESESSFTIS